MNKTLRTNLIAEARRAHETLGYDQETACKAAFFNLGYYDGLTIAQLKALAFGVTFHGFGETTKHSV